MAKQSTSTDNNAAPKAKRQPKKHYTFVGIKIDKDAEIIAGFFGTFKEAAEALSSGKIIAVSVWEGQNKVSR